MSRATKPAPISFSNTNIVSGDKLKLTMTFDFNCRNPSPHSKAYQSMRETLRENPESFLDLNGGIVVANGQYILDGGHTFMAIKDAITSGELEDPRRVQVRITDLGELTKDQMAERSVALNRRITPPLYGERDVLGHWDKLKATVKNASMYEFRPNTNDDARYDVSFLIALLNGWKANTAEKSYSGKGGLVRLYKDDKYAKELPQLNTMIEVYSKIYEKFLEDKKLLNRIAGFGPAREVVLPNGKRVTGFLPESYIWPIYGAFRSIVDKDGELTQDPIELLEKKWPTITKQLLIDYKHAGSSPGKYGRDSQYYLNMTVAILGAK